MPWSASCAKATKDHRTMTTKQALKHFKSYRKLAAALGLSSVGTITNWGEHPPPMMQIDLERITNGKLRMSADIRERLPA